MVERFEVVEDRDVGERKSRSKTRWVRKRDREKERKKSDSTKGTGGRKRDWC